MFINTKGNSKEEFSQEFLDLMAYITASTDGIAEKYAPEYDCRKIYQELSMENGI